MAGRLLRHAEARPRRPGENAAWSLFGSRGTAAPLPAPRASNARRPSTIPPIENGSSSPKARRPGQGGRSTGTTRQPPFAPGTTSPPVIDAGGGMPTSKRRDGKVERAVATPPRLRGSPVAAVRPHGTAPRRYDVGPKLCPPGCDDRRHASAKSARGRYLPASFGEQATIRPSISTSPSLPCRTDSLDDGLGLDRRR